MITITCTYLNPENFKPIGNLQKTFLNQEDFSQFYKIVKADPCVIMNVRNYDISEKKALHEAYDMLLINVSKENPL